MVHCRIDNLADSRCCGLEDGNVTRVVAKLAVLCWVLASGAAFAASDMVDRGGAVLQGLDKITARVSSFDVSVGETAHFGTLLVTLRACREARQSAAGPGDSRRADLAHAGRHG